MNHQRSMMSFIPIKAQPMFGHFLTFPFQFIPKD